MRKTHGHFENYELDTEVFCLCGERFRIYVFSPYKCIRCGRLYEAKTVVEEISEDEVKDNFYLVGK